MSYQEKRNLVKPLKMKTEPTEPSDKELLFEFVEKCTEFINPALYKELRRRNIAYLVEGLPFNKADARVEIVARLHKEEEAAQKRKLRQQQREEDERNERNLKREEVRKFYAQYKVPFRFKTEIKERLSGLREGSSGNGSARNTVLHLVTLEGFQEGRLKREGHQFLCSQSASKWSANWSGTLGDDLGQTWSDGSYNQYQAPITCKQCLKIMERWKVQ